MDADDEYCCAVLVQGTGEDQRVITLMTRELAIMESMLPKVERYLVVAHWGMKRFSRYTLFLPSVRVVIPDPAVYVAVRN